MGRFGLWWNSPQGIPAVLLILALAGASPPARASGGLPVDGYLTVEAGGGMGVWSPPVALAGVRGYAVLSRAVHVGGFADWRADVPTIHSIVLGGSGRFGGALSDGLWLGFDLDLGLSVANWLFARSLRPKDLVGVDPPAFYLGFGAALVYLHPVGAVSLGLEAQLGGDFLFGGELRSEEGDTGSDSPIMSLAAVAHLGLTVGFGGP